MSMNKMWVLNISGTRAYLQRFKFFSKPKKEFAVKYNTSVTIQDFVEITMAKKKVAPNVYLSNSHNCLIFQTNSIFMYRDVVLVTF